MCRIRLARVALRSRALLSRVSTTTHSRRSLRSRSSILRPARKEKREIPDCRDQKATRAIKASRERRVRRVTPACKDQKVIGEIRATREIKVTRVIRVFRERLVRRAKRV